MRLLVTGTGRSGTGYLAELLRRCGVACGHETVHTPGTALGDEIVWGPLQADASWLAVPRLGELRESDDVHVVLVSRHPIAVARSFLALGVLDRHDVYTSVIRHTTPTTMQVHDPIERALVHWCTWTALAALHAIEIVALEHLTSDHVYTWVKLLDGDCSAVESAWRETPRDLNRKDEAKQPVPVELLTSVRYSIRREVAQRAAALGYRA